MTRWTPQQREEARQRAIASNLTAKAAQARHDRARLQPRTDALTNALRQFLNPHKLEST